MAELKYLSVGAGKMGGALLSGWVAGGDVAPKTLAILDPNPGTAAQDIIAKGARSFAVPSTEFGSIEIVLLAIKPQMFSKLAPDIARVLSEDALVISVLAGTSLSSLQSVFKTQALIRAMPNTPASIGQGITAFTAAAGVTEAQKAKAKMLLSAGGPVHEVETEALIDVVTAVSGSGPAYVFYMVEALEAAAIKAGLPAEIAPAFARQTVVGAGALLGQSTDTATQLRQAVTSPNGTTQAALDVLMAENGLPLLMRETVKAALKRAKELSLE